MKYFNLLTKATADGRDLLQPVVDMAAYFDYSVGEGSACSLELREQEKGWQALLTLEGTTYTGYCAYGNSATGQVSRCVKVAAVEAFTKATGLKPSLPWGVLTGVRPGKLAHKLIDQGLTFQELPNVLAKEYLLPNSQGQLLTKICQRQKELLADKDRFQEAGLYIGIPFCPSRCSYCSFPAGIVPEDEESQENFLNLIEQDLENVVQLLSMHSLKITSLYVGGGTPTSLSERVFGRFMDGLAKVRLPYLQEFTVEAGRPDCFSAGKLAAMEAAGVNRISVNPQTFNDSTLRAIGRSHTVADFYQAYTMVRESSIPVINMDLIIGLPGEDPHMIEGSLTKALELDPENLTVHTLTLKRSTPLFGGSHSLDPAEAGALVAKAMELAQGAGLAPYYLYRQHYMLGHLANIGYAKAGTESLYNIQMMEERHPVFGVGPSSATKLPLRDGHHLAKLTMPKNVNIYGSRLQELFAKRAALLAPAGE